MRDQLRRAARMSLETRSTCVAAFAALLLWFMPATPCPAASYAVTDVFAVPFALPSDPSYFYKPWLAINNSGQVVISGVRWGGYRYSSGQLEILRSAGNPDNGFTRVFGIGPNGDAVGGSIYPAIINWTEANIWNSGGGVTTLGLYDGWNSSAYAINGSGQVVGGSDPFGFITTQQANSSLSFTSHAFLYDDGMFHDLGTLDGARYSLAYDINSSGRIVGMSMLGTPTQFGINGPKAAFFSDGGPMQNLNSLIGATSWTLDAAAAINDAGQVAGWGMIGGATHAFLYDAGTVQDIGVLPGFDWSIGRGINADGDVVGYAATGTLSYYYLTATGDDRAFLYRDGVSYDLNSLIDPASGWVLHGATDINDSGQIVGWGTLTGENPQYIHALLLTPVPEPSTLVLGGLALVALFGWPGGRRILCLVSGALAPACRCLSAVLLIWSAMASLCDAANYAVTDMWRNAAPANIGYLGKPLLAINNNGQVAFSGAAWFGYRYSSGQLQVLDGTSPDRVFSSRVFAIDNVGNAIGGFPNLLSDFTELAIWNVGGGVTKLGVHDGWNSVGYGVNSSGQIVGGSDPFGYTYSESASQDWHLVSHAFLYDDGVFHDLGALGGPYSVAMAINDPGRIVGWSLTAPAPFGIGASTTTRAFVSDGGPMQDLNSLSGSSDWSLDAAVAINDSGQIAGWGAIGGATHAFLFDTDGVHDIGVLPGFSMSAGRGINTQGDVVGYSANGTLSLFAYYVATGDDRAFLYRDGVTYDLNSLIDPASGWVLHGATDINDSGQIVGWGTLTGENPQYIHALLLTPVPEPSTLVLSGLALVALFGWPGGRRILCLVSGGLAPACRCLSAVLLIWSAMASLCAAANYAVADLGANRHAQYFSDKPWMAVNNSGQVVISGEKWTGARYTSGQWHDLSGAYFDNVGPRVFGIDADGNALGGSFYPDGFTIFVEATVWNAANSLTTLGLHDGWNSAAYAINASGQIVGGSDPLGYKESQIANLSSSFASHAFLYDGGAFHDLGTLGGRYSLAHSINNGGRIVGMSTLDGPPVYGVQAPTRAFFSDGGPMQDLNSLVGPTSWTLDAAAAINDAGQVAGWGTVDGATHAFLYDAGTVQDIGVLPGFEWSIGRGINADADVVGFSATGTLRYDYLTATGDDRAFLYRNGVTYDLNSLIDPASGWVLHGATDINDSGQIVGWGTLTGENPQYIHALLLTPVPEPSTLVLGGLALVALFGWPGGRQRLWRR